MHTGQKEKEEIEKSGPAEPVFEGGENSRVKKPGTKWRKRKKDSRLVG